MRPTAQLARTPEYRGPDRRTPVEGPASTRGSALASALGTGALGALGGLTIAVALGGLDAGGAAVGYPADALDALAAILAGHLALTAWTCGRATGQTVGARLSGSAALLAVALMTDLGVFAGGTALVVRTTALVLAALWAAAAVVGPAVEVRRRIVGHAAATGAVLGLVAAGALLTPPPASTTLFAGAATVTAGCWSAVLVLWLRTARQRDDAVITWALLVPATVTAAEVLRLTGGPDPSLTLAAAAGGLRAGGVFAASVGIAVGLAAHVSGRRAEVLRAQAQLRVVERRQLELAQEREHEVANALFAIEGAASTMSRHAGELTEITGRQLADSVTLGLLRLRALLDDDDAGTLTRACTDVPLAEVVTERATLARGRGVAVEVSGDLEVTARGNAVAIAQVVDNLLLNAVRHGGAGRDVPVTIRLAVEAGRAVIRVTDRGPGVPAASREAVFDRGVQLDPDGEGDGLGLFVSRRLLREIGGDLEVCDASKGGACFVATLPLGMRTGARIGRG